MKVRTKNKFYIGCIIFSLICALFIPCVIEGMVFGWTATVEDLWKHNPYFVGMWIFIFPLQMLLAYITGYYALKYICILLQKNKFECQCSICIN